MTRFLILREDPANPHRLGRHQIPDAFPKNKDARNLGAFFAKIKTVTHAEHVPAFNQGSIGSCTANAALGTLVCDPLWEPGLSAKMTEATAVDLYAAETLIDDDQLMGHFPPDDTGSTGPWSMRALEQWGWIDDYVHTRSTHVALGLLNKAPISIGVPWTRSMFTPDKTGTIHVDPTSGLAGGHQVAVVGNDAENQRVYIRNSWGPGWGIDGHAWLSWAELEYLLTEGGDVVQPIKNR